MEGIAWETAAPDDPKRPLVAFDVQRRAALALVELSVAHMPAAARTATTAAYDGATTDP